MTQSIFQAQPFELPLIRAQLHWSRSTCSVTLSKQGASVRHWAMMFHWYARLSHHVQRCWQPHVKKGIMVIHTREGHRADLSDCPPAKLTRGGKPLLVNQTDGTHSGQR